MRNYRGLAFLASLSAIATDLYINKGAKEKDYPNVKELAKELGKISKERLDPKGLLMLTEVIWPNIEDWEGKKDDDVYLQINLLAKDLTHFREFSRKRQEELRDVCVKLSKKSMHYSYPYKLRCAT